MVYALQSKNIYPLLFNELTKPKVYINAINGLYYDKDNELVDIEKAIDIILNIEDSIFIIKPSANSCSGGGVKIIDKSLYSRNQLLDELLKMGDYFICQECVQQSSITSQFNSSSLNSFRINTLNLNGNITVENIIFRHGKKGSVVDNVGAGGICVGFNNDGHTVGFAIDAKLCKYEFTPFGQRYADVYIPEVKNLVKDAIQAHQRYLPMMGHAAWDFALDKDNQSVFIEVNLGWPGLVAEQLSSARPIFRDRTEEVIHYVSNNLNRIEFTDFIGNWT